RIWSSASSGRSLVRLGSADLPAQPLPSFPKLPAMKAYLDLLREIRTAGTRKPQRATLRSDGRRPDVLSVFGRQIRFDLSQGFPLVTTKRMPWAAVVHELLWFLAGSTNVKYLRENKVTIWDEWADDRGELGPVYGKQWRRW